MDFLHEGFALGLDLIVLGYWIREYIIHKNNLKALKGAPQLAIDHELKNYVSRHKNQKVKYVCIRGTVNPIGTPLRSVLAPSVTGVLQFVKLYEHRITRGIAGLWSEQSKLLHTSFNEMPFELRNSDISVEIVDALSASILDMDVVYDNYEQSTLSFFDNIFGFFSGIRQKGIQTTEEVLREGSFITAVGEIELDGNSLRLQPSKSGPLVLTTATKAALIKKLEKVKASLSVKLIIFGSISVILIGCIVRKLYLKKKQEREERNIKEVLEKQRRERRSQNRPGNLSREQLCVVCSQNPKEVIILPCGHVCLCEDCSEKIRQTCPVCRSKIDKKAAAFIA